MVRCINLIRLMMFESIPIIFMTYVQEHGRMGNTVIRNLAISFIAKKFDLKVTYWRHAELERLGIDLFSGSREYPQKLEIVDDNYFSIYRRDTLEYNLDCPDYYQRKEIADLLYDHLHSKEVKEKIMESNPFYIRYNQNNDLFIHIRLGDVPQYNPGVHYYLEMMKRIQFDHVFISTDSPDHPMVQQILQEYPKAMLFLQDEVTTFQFASTAKHVLLSNGTFSAIIGYLAYYSTVYYPEYRYIWHGDMFSIPSWNRVSFVK